MHQGQKKRIYAILLCDTIRDTFFPTAAIPLTLCVQQGLTRLSRALLSSEFFPVFLSVHPSCSFRMLHHHHLLLPSRTIESLNPPPPWGRGRAAEYYTPLEDCFVAASTQEAAREGRLFLWRPFFLSSCARPGGQETVRDYAYYAHICVRCLSRACYAQARAATTGGEKLRLAVCWLNCRKKVAALCGAFFESFPKTLNIYGISKDWGFQ